MRSGPRLAVLVALALPGGPPASTSSLSNWSQLASPHFDVITDAGPETARRVARDLERFREAIAQIFPARQGEDEPRTGVLALDSAAQFTALLPAYRGVRQALDGYMVTGAGRTWIVANLGASRQRPSEVVWHEYAHVFLNGSLPAQPAWVAEGLAEVLSGWEEDAGGVRVGAAEAAHLQVLGERGPMPLAALLETDYASPTYNEADSQALFYAQSWALVHALIIGGQPQGRAALAAYLESLGEGKPATEAFTRAFGPLAGLEALLRRYVPGAVLPELKVELRAPLPEPVLAPVEAPPALVEFARGDVLLQGQRGREAEPYLRRALEADPRFAPAHEAMAQLALERGRWAEARRHLQAALDLEPSRPAALYRKAQALVREAASRGQPLSAADTAAAVAALEQALRLSPHLAEACELLVELQPQPINVRLRQVTRAWGRNPQRAQLGLSLAHLHLLTKDVSRAAAALTRVRQLARDDSIRFVAEHLLRRLSEGATGTRAAEGTLAAVECPPAGGLVFVVRDAGGPLRLRVPSPREVFLYDAAGQPVERTFVCGPQGGRVRVWYRAGLQAAAEGGKAALREDDTLLSVTFLGPG